MQNIAINNNSYEKQEDREEGKNNDKKSKIYKNLHHKVTKGYYGNYTQNAKGHLNLTEDKEKNYDEKNRFFDTEEEHIVYNE